MTDHGLAAKSSSGEAAEPTASTEEAAAMLKSMLGTWTGWFDEYGGVDGFHARMREQEDTEESEPLR